VPIPSAENRENWRPAKHSLLLKMQPALLLVTTVDLVNGEQDQIELHEGEQPRDAAQKFCEAHGLPEAVVQPLVQHILTSLESSMETRQEETGVRLRACVQPTIRSHVDTPAYVSSDDRTYYHEPDHHSYLKRM
jgi:hypothetical protein